MPKSYPNSVRRQISHRLRSGDAKMIVGRSFSTTADTALVNNAVNIAAQERIRWETTILHADHGPQFTSWGFGENLRRWGLLESFGTVGDCLLTG